MKSHIGKGTGTTLCGRKSGFPMGEADGPFLEDPPEHLCATCLRLARKEAQK